MARYLRNTEKNPLDAVEKAYKLLRMWQPLDPVRATRIIVACMELKKLDSPNAKKYAEYIERVEDLYLYDKLKYHH